uniref:Metalloenzyme domain-containing protein n=1 Tax=Lactuca sativa TaxID=4236 RepID=A0A9R1V5E7_LACSA|nr:hypothetical protein LSAT_V11C700365130 [Lactuca sativa]
MIPTTGAVKGFGHNLEEAYMRWNKPVLLIQQANRGIRFSEEELRRVCLNISNSGMVGHTSDVEATVVACKAAKEAVKMILDAVDQVGGIFVVTVDHGNAEDMVKMNKKG